MKTNHVHEHDTSVTAWYEVDYTDADVAATRDAILAHLRSRGFHLKTDPEIKKKYPILAPHHHVGHNGDLNVHIEQAGRSVKVEFWQDLVVENRNGGRYDFHRRQRMPYLIGKQYDNERSKLMAMLGARGLEVRPAKPRLAGMDFVNQKRAECWHWNGGKILEMVGLYGNDKMRDGSRISEGDTVYFADYWAGYRIVRGVARYNLNNMWWVVLPCGSVRNIASFELYRREALPADLSGRHVNKRHAAKQVERLKDAAVKAENYERAAVLRDVLKAVAA